MRGRLIFPLLLGIAGTAILLGLATWQLQRMAWKQEVIARIEARIDATPQPLPETPRPEAHRYMPVEVTGRFTDAEAHVISSRRGVGPGYEIITAFVTDDGRRILVDRGFVAESDKTAERRPHDATITGNLHWPRDFDSFTPEPELERNIWFSRAVRPLAEYLDTEPLLVVLRESSAGDTAGASGPDPVPVSPDGIPDNHLEYAITWALLALVWAGMTGLLVWRIRQREA